MYDFVEVNILRAESWYVWQGWIC